MRSETSLQSVINWSVPEATRRFGDRLVKRIYLTEPEPRSVAEQRLETKSSKAEQEATPAVNGCTCASFGFTCCDTRPPGAICSCCFISPSNQLGHKDPANKDSRSRRAAVSNTDHLHGTSSFVLVQRFEEKQQPIHVGNAKILFKCHRPAH